MTRILICFQVELNKEYHDLEHGHHDADDGDDNTSRSSGVWLIGDGSSHGRRGVSQEEFNVLTR